VLDEGTVNCLAFIFKQAAVCFYSGLTQIGKSTPVHNRIGVSHACHYPSDSGPDKGITAGWGLAGMAAWFQRDKNISASGRFIGLLKSKYFGMGPTGPPVPTFADYNAILDNNAAHGRIRRCLSNSFSGQSQGAFHVFCVNGGHFFNSS
jgi:hypothetical protein